MGLAITGAAVAVGVGVYFGKIKPRKAIEQIKNVPDSEIVEKITDITQDGISKLLAENGKLTGKFSKTMEDGSRVVMEYSNGVLRKSTKTAKDGALIFEKIYEQTNKGLFVNGINLTEIAQNAKKHQEDFKNLINKQDISLEELQNFNKKNLSKKQITELDVKIKAKQEALEKAAKEAQEAAEKLAKENEKKFFELIGRPNITIDELRKTDVSALTSEQVEILNKKIQVLEDMSQAEKAFKSKARKSMPAEEERMKELLADCSPGSRYYKEMERMYKDENQYLDMLWINSDEYRELCVKNKLISLSPTDRINFDKVKKLLKQNEITYTDADVLAHIDDWRYFEVKQLDNIVDYNTISTHRNAMLREGMEPDFECRVLDKIIEQQKPLESKQVFYRGVSSVGDTTWNNTKLNDIYIDKLVSSQVGDIVIDKGYSYFSTNTGVLEQYSNNRANKKARMIIEVPQGAKVKLGKCCPGGREGIFPRNSQFRVIRKAEMVDGIPEIVLEYILPKK